MASMSTVLIALWGIGMCALGYFYGWHTRGTVEHIKQTEQSIKETNEKLERLEGELG